MTPIETFFGVILAALAIALLGKRLDQPYPIALVLGGIALELIPGMPELPLNPDLVFYVFLPPILSEAAYFTSWRDFVRYRRAIFMLAFGLVIATTAVVAAICVYMIPGMNWATGFVLGAIVSPPDAAAATAVTRGMRLPRRIVQIVEGESLVNDAAALTLYRFAVAAIATGAFSLGQAALAFVWIGAGGVAVGAGLGFLYVKTFRWLKDPQIETLSTFLISYLSYFLAETIHVSGVLACVASGMILGWFSPELFSATMRIRTVAVWQTVVFLLNALIFILIGLQLPQVISGLAGYPVDVLLGWSVALSAGVILVRLAWMFPGAYLPRMLSRSIRENEPAPPWTEVLIVGWTGLRGVISLAAALALPEETERGLPFPYRHLLLLLSFAVIVATLLLQGLTLRPLVRRLKIPPDQTSEEEQCSARIHSTERALERLAEIERTGGAPESVLARIRGYLEDRLSDLRAQVEQETGAATVNRPEEFQSIAEQRVWWEMARVQREAVLEMRRSSKIGDEAMREIERDIDLLEARIVPQS